MADIYGPECDCLEHVGIRGYGPEDAEVMAIGIAPGRDEVRVGRPFVGPAGKRFDAVLGACGYPRSKVYATNLICWHNDAPTFPEIAQCWPRLRQEIELRQPRVILALGALASEWLTGFKVGKVRGSVLSMSDLAPGAHLRELTQKREIYLVGGISQREVTEALAATGAGGILYPRVIAALSPEATISREVIPIGLRVLPTWHPAATLGGRNPALVGDLVRDFRKIPRILAGELDPPQIETCMVTTHAEAQQVLYWLSYREVALDVETTFDTPKAWGRLLCLSIATRLPSNVYCKEEKYVSYVFPRSLITPELVWPTSIKWGFHNGPFDRNVLRRELGIDLPITWDSMYYSYSCDERPGYDRDDRAGDSGSSGAGRNKAMGPGYHSLDQLAREYLGGGFFKDDTKDWIGQDPGTPERWEALYKRNALDAAYTAALPYRLPAGHSAPCYRSLLIPTANAYADVQQTGIRVDQARLQQLESEWTQAREGMVHDLEDWASDLGFKNPPKRKRDSEGEPFNPASPQQLARILFGADFLDLKPRVRSKKTKAPSTAEAVLKDLIDELLASDPESEGARFLRLLIRSRKYASTLKYFPLLRDNLRPDGRVHPTFLPLVTGRYSAVDPPMQTFTQPYKLEADGVPELAALRSVIVPSPGMALIARDYDQLEIHVGAWLSGDEQMKADLRLPFPESPDGAPDYHSRVTRDVLGCTAPYGSAEWSKTRRGAKVFTFGIEYGEGAEGLARHAAKETGARFTRARAQAIISAWYARYQRFGEWQKEQIRAARRSGYIENPFGFIRRFPFPDSVFDTQIKNCSIQGTASQHGTVAMVELVAGEQYWTKESYLAGFPAPVELAAGHDLTQIGGSVLLTIHDEILAEVPEDRVAEGQELLRVVMEYPRVPGWPGMATAGKTSYTNWQEMHE